MGNSPPSRSQAAWCMWCPGSSGVDTDIVPSPNGTKKIQAKKSSNLTLRNEVATFVRAVEADYLLKSTENGFMSTRMRKRTRGASFEMMQIDMPNDFEAKNLVLRRPKGKANRASQRDSDTTPEATPTPTA
ncbi:unnamed protein product [Aphanomyces euteiches]|uniref:Uncharacterized protein n=1 Tax=Aphanomyces euteiches TaxID=100861 RepID=A0A6G0WKM0_9STRA|nr:hypothetical protein Ae201684_014226 [Aphanomyces euteiches]KAH9068773.1 hypothetical protein Ae201684P_004474 [Aphanomyces euteiches]KAH9104933.1 hypothetical protein AeMF1_019133 [Aphanomyces euteiches]KAH9156786.1 hypothetical protein AeRB84_001330 [Aphanomyces euteiches]KAH9162876.1 hypothetical protein LEN26_000759 [Aphanomyces euteiches]